MIKAAFFDIDGTLLSFHTHQVSPGTVRAFDALRRQGIATFISSGRPQVIIPPMPLTFDGYVTMNGGYCFMGDHVLLKNPIPQEQTDSWIAYVRTHGLCTMVCTEDEIYVNELDNELGLKIRDQLEFRMPALLPTDEMVGRETYQIIAIMPQSCDTEVQQMLPHCRLPRWHPEFTDIINADNSKAAGIESIIRPLGICPEECIGFGDGGNDLEMLDYCGIGVAMGNAADSVKAHADYVTTSVDNEGIERALLALNIIK